MANSKAKPRAADAALILVTVGSEEQASAIGRTLVDEGLAACINVIGPIQSIYRWQSAVQEEREYLLLIKARELDFTVIERRVRELHTYELPEVMGLRFDRGSRPYLEWMLASTGTAWRSKRSGSGQALSRRSLKRARSG